MLDPISDKEWDEQLKYTLEAESERDQLRAELEQVKLSLLEALVKRTFAEADMMEAQAQVAAQRVVMRYIEAQWSRPVWPPPNVWRLVSCEDQRTADEQIPWLLKTPAAIRGVSLEPLLGVLDIWQYLGGNRNPIGPAYGGKGLDWVITGGQSGPGAAPSHPDWFRGVRDACLKAGVPLFFKGWGEWAPRSHGFYATDDRRWGVVDSDGTFTEKATPWNGHDDDGSGEATMVRVGKKAAGRLLDGREWSQMPEGK